jgi:hypothetical protein
MQILFDGGLGFSGLAWIFKLVYNEERPGILVIIGMR